MRGEHGRGLVENEDLGVVAEGLEDLDALLRADGEVLDRSRGVDVEVVLIGQGDDAFGGAAVVDEGPGLDGLAAEDDVVGNREDRDEHEVLVHHADSLGHGVLGVANGHDLVVDEYLTAVGRDHAVEHVHERGLARAVLSEQAVYLPWLDDEVDIPVGRERTEVLVDRSQFQFHESQT